MELFSGLDNGGGRATSPDHPPMVEGSRANEGGLMMNLGKLLFERENNGQDGQAHNIMEADSASVKWKTEFMVEAGI